MPITAKVPTTPGAAGRHRVLPHDEVVRLARVFQEGQAALTDLEDPTGLSEDDALRKRQIVADGVWARDVILLHNLRLVAHNARRYAVDGLTFDDHFQDGCRGLLRAVEKFDPDAGFRFSTYATWWIRQSITRGIADTARLIRLPVHLTDDLRRLDAARQRIIGETGRAPVSQLALATGFGRDKVERLRGLLAGPVSLDAVVGDGLTTLGDLLPALENDDRDRAEVKDIVAEQLAALSTREREVLALRFGLDGSQERTLEQVGNVFGLTRERIRQIEAKALDKLRPGLTKALERRPPPSDDTEATHMNQRAGSRLQAIEARSIDGLKPLRDELAPRCRRLLDELSGMNGVGTSAELLEAMGLPASAPVESILDGVDAALTTIGLPPVGRDGPRLVLDAPVASAWRVLKEPE